MSELKDYELLVKCKKTGKQLVVSKTHYWKFEGTYEVIEGEVGETPAGISKPFVFSKPPEIKDKELQDPIVVKEDGKEVKPKRPPAKPPAIKKVTPPKVNK